MADAEETPAQRQARIRRQKREAKITGSATERLDKITRLSGRTPESVRNPSPAVTPRAPSPSQTLPPADPSVSASPEQVQAQREYLRALLRQPVPQDGPDTTQDDEDPMMKMLQAMMGGGMDGAAEGAGPGAGAGLNISPEDISKATGLPSLVTNMLMGGQRESPTAAEIRASRLWKIVHVIFSVVAGSYLAVSIDKATQTFGEDPPAPATFQNPFVLFLTGELLIQTTRVVTKGHSGKGGPRLWWQMGKELIGDGAVLVFILGIARWLKGSA